ncbi:GNAT family N-acetyltransferase [Neorhizobium sp. CSC1952]|uniref:GNAT family N-acetyltransferase n=1 Tax=Neorhizobium sp. CSC1952 TaxID=2978974 RepID=UPI0025A63BDD|nr:GNAT family N-acetyltransferase [Rhizobium sp. CSC1952]WJR67954.1 GNAT family N-acetyltransferase [Rhizobium sp. CSC1952]
MDIWFRPFGETDLPEYRTWFAADEELSRRISYPDDIWFGHVRRPENACWASVDHTNTLIAVLQVDREDGTGYLDIALRPERRGRGLGTAVLSAFLAGPGHGYGVIEGRISPDNAAALALVRRCGFTLLPDPDDDGFVRAIYIFSKT